ncbi:unnamed protein product [Penicillium discolor]
MRDVHGVAELPGDTPPPRDERRANVVVPAYFAAYEEAHDLPVLRPVHVRRVRDDAGVLLVEAEEGEWRTRTLVNATGTWTQPFVPHYPGMETFLGEQFHTVDYPGPEHFRGKRVLVVGGGASAVQFLGALAPLTETLAAGGIQLDRGGRGTTAVADPRVQLVGYGPSASTIGANRAGRAAAAGVVRALAKTGAVVSS